MKSKTIPSTLAPHAGTSNILTRTLVRPPLAARLLAGGAVIAAGMAAAGPGRAEELDVSARHTYENPGYSEPDSLFMIGFKPVTVTIDGTVPGLTDETIEQSVRAGMRSSPPVVCCAGADRNFRARAPLVVVMEQRAAASSGGGDADGYFAAPAGDGMPGDDRRRYAVEWKFAKSADARVVAYASLYHGSDLLTQASGALDLSASQAAAVPPEAMTALVRSVEGNLTFFPTSLMAPIAGGG